MLPTEAVSCCCASHSLVPGPALGSLLINTLEPTLAPIDITITSQMRKRGRKKLLRLTLPQQINKKISRDLDTHNSELEPSRLSHTQAIFKKQKPASHSYVFRLSYLISQTVSDRWEWALVVLTRKPTEVTRQEWNGT